MKGAGDLVAQSIRQAAAEHNLKRNTQSRYVEKLRNSALGEIVCQEPNYARRKIFITEQKNKIELYVSTYSKINCGLKKADLKQKVYKIAIKSDIKISAYRKMQRKAGDD